MDQQASFKILSKSKIVKQLGPSLAPPMTRFCLHPKRTMAIEKVVLRQHCATVVAPKVASVAKQLFSQDLHVVDLDESGPCPASLSTTRATHRANPLKMTWGSAASTKHFYNSVSIDGITYTVCCLHNILSSGFH